MPLLFLLQSVPWCVFVCCLLGVSWLIHPLKLHLKSKSKFYIDNKELTAHGHRLLEYLGDLGIHFDHDVFLVRNFFVPYLNLFLNPFCKWFLDNGGTYITQPRLWNFWKLKVWLRKVVINIRVL